MHIEQAVLSLYDKGGIVVRINAPYAVGNAADSIYGDGITVRISQRHLPGRLAAVAPGVQIHTAGRGRGILVVDKQVNADGFATGCAELVGHGDGEVFRSQRARVFGLKGIGIRAARVDMEDAIRAVDREAALTVRHAARLAEGRAGERHLIMPLLIRVVIRVAEGKIAFRRPVRVTQSIQFPIQIARDFGRGIGVVQIDGDGAGGRAEITVIHRVGEGFHGVTSARRRIRQHIAVLQGAGTAVLIEIQRAVPPVHHKGGLSLVVFTPDSNRAVVTGSGIQAHAVAVRVADGQSAGNLPVGIAQGIHVGGSGLGNGIVVDIIEVNIQRSLGFHAVGIPQRQREMLVLGFALVIGIQAIAVLPLSVGFPHFERSVIARNPESPAGGIRRAEIGQAGVAVDARHADGIAFGIRKEQPGTDLRLPHAVQLGREGAGFRRGIVIGQGDGDGALPFAAVGVLHGVGEDFLTRASLMRRVKLITVCAVIKEMERSVLALYRVAVLAVHGTARALSVAEAQTAGRHGIAVRVNIRGDGTVHTGGPQTVQSSCALFRNRIVIADFMPDGGRQRQTAFLRAGMAVCAVPLRFGGTAHNAQVAAVVDGGGHFQIHVQDNRGGCAVVQRDLVQQTVRRESGRQLHCRRFFRREQADGVPRARRDSHALRPAQNEEVFLGTVRISECRFKRNGYRRLVACLHVIKRLRVGDAAHT